MSSRIPSFFKPQPEMKRVAGDGAAVAAKRVKPEDVDDAQKRLTEVKISLEELKTELSQLPAITNEYVRLVTKKDLELKTEVLAKKKEMVEREIQVLKRDNPDFEQDQEYIELKNKYKTLDNEKEAKLQAFEIKIAPLYSVALPSEKEEVREMAREMTWEEFVNILATIPMIPEVTTHHPDQQAIIFGPFNRPEVKWPIVRDGKEFRLDLEFLPTLSGSSVRPSAEVILEQLDRKTAAHYHLLAAVSGSGKTSAFADVARSYFVIYIQCGTESERSAFRKSRGQDDGFLELLKMYRTFRQEGRFEQNMAHAERIATIEIVCRLSQLYRLLQLKPDLTSFEFYIHQRNVRDEWLRKLRSRIDNLSEKSCKTILEEMVKGFDDAGIGKLILAIDEIEPALKAFENDFDPDSAKHNGFLTPLIHAVDSLRSIAQYTVIFAGTASSFDRSVTIKSGIGKESSLDMHQLEVSKMFPVANLAACQKFMENFNLDGVMDVSDLSDDVIFDKDFQLDGSHSAVELMNYCVVDTRFRVLMRIAIELSKMDHSSGEDKSRCFYQAVERAIGQWYEDLMEYLRRALTDRMKMRDAQEFGSILVQLWTGLVLNGGKFTIFTRNDDLMKLGLGNFAGSMESEEEIKPEFIQGFSLGGYEVTERLVMICIRDILRKYSDQVTQASYAASRRDLAAFLEKHGNIPAKGNLFENVVSHALCRSEFQNKRVSELPFVKPFIGSHHKNGWLFKTNFHAKKIWSRHQLSPSQSTPSFLASQEARGVVYSPESTARFDGIVMLDADHAISLGMTVWTNIVPKSKIESQFLSTDLSKAYFLTDGITVNENCIVQRTEWERLKLDKVKAARVHIALPRFTNSIVQQFTVSLDEIAIHLDHTNCHLLLGSDPSLFALLARATGRPLEDWGERKQIQVKKRS